MTDASPYDRPGSWGEGVLQTPKQPCDQPPIDESAMLRSAAGARSSADRDQMHHDIGSGPRFPEVGVIAIVPDRWSTFWQPRHYVLSTLAKHFRVAWVEPAIDWRAVVARSREARVEALPLPDGLTIHAPHRWLPVPFRPRWLGQVIGTHRLRRARRQLVGAGCRHIVLYVWRPTYAAALQQVASTLAVYHVDDEYAFSDEDPPTDSQERELIEQVDQVFIHSPALLEKKGGLNPHTSLVPNGVDFERFSRPVREPADLASVPHPRIGYIGFLKRQLDWPLLRALISRHPDWSFVFVGARSPHVELNGHIDVLEQCSNVYFLGGRPPHELGRYPQHFDVCLMPYSVTGYTKYIYPLKLHEYLAGGRPVVGARIRSLEAFQHVVTLAQGVDGWSAAIASALEADANTPERRRLRQETAFAHDWQRLVHGIAEVILARLREKGFPLHEPFGSGVAPDGALPVSGADSGGELVRLEDWSPVIPGQRGDSK